MSLRQGFSQQAQAPAVATATTVTLAAEVITLMPAPIETSEDRTVPVTKLAEVTDVKVAPQHATWAQTSLNYIHDMTTMVSEKALSLHAQYIEPISKEQVDKFIVSSVGFSTYYGLVSAAKLEGASTFAVRAEVSMGFKLFNAVANPFLAQFVESFTEVHTNNAKYMFYSAKCAIWGDNCEDLAALNNPFKINLPDEKSSLIQDFMQFDLKRYFGETSTNLDGINIKSLISGGIISASASQVVDTVYEETGLKPYVQGYFMKNWGSYYFKEWVKSEIRHEADILKTMTEKVLGLNEAKPLEMSDILMPASNDIITAPHAQASSPVIPIMDTITLQVPMQVVAPDVVL